MKPRRTQLVGILVDHQHCPAPVEVLRTAMAAVASLLMAELLQLPNPYWATISCLIVVLSSAGSELAVSVQRCVGTGLGAGLAAAAAYCFGSNPASFGVTVLGLGTVCWVARIHRGAFRYGSIAAAIVILVPHVGGAGPIALHRFVEVSLGIGVGLATAAAWPQPGSVRGA